MAKIVSVQLKGVTDPVIVHNVEVIETGGPDLALHPPGNTGVIARFTFDRVIDWWIVGEDRIN